MIGDFVLAALALVAILAIPVAVIVLLVGQSRLKRRVTDLERRLSHQAASAPIATPAADVPPQFREAVADTPPAEPPQPAVMATQAWPQPAAPFATPPVAAPDDGPIVLRADRASALMAWVQRNWIYVVAAASLALAGVFLVQYSVQNGLLPPWARVVAAYLMGGALVVAGEWLRRRRGDDEGSDTAYLPSVFAGAGIVTLFAATTAARQLYDLIGPNPAFALHIVTAALAVVLGWFYGPLLVAVGLIGAFAAPFLISSPADPTPLMYGYYALIAATGLAVDAMRRWAWLSVLALVLAYLGGGMMMSGGAGQGAWLAFLLALPILSILLPPLRLTPDHAGPAVLQTFLHRRASGWPVFPTRLAAGAVVVSTLGLTLLQGETALIGMLALAALTLLALTLLIWAEKAEGLADLALLPALALIARLMIEAGDHWPLVRDFMSRAMTARPPESAAPLTVTWIVVLAACISGAFAYRALRGGPLSLIHGLGAVLAAPVAVAVLELFWQPALVLGDWVWALHPMALAAAMVALAARFARRDGADHRRMAHATLSALSLIALALFLLTSSTALTLALAALVLVAAGLDRRFDLREMGLFIQIAVAVIAFRLLINPGLDWAMDALLLPVLAVFVGSIGAEVAAHWLIRDRGRVMTSGVLESAALALSAVLATVLLTRWIAPTGRFDSMLDLNYLAALNAIPWLVLALTQVYRAGLTPVLRRTRLGLGAFAGVLAGLGLLAAALPLNPLLAHSADETGAKVIGPMVFDSLALSYALPGLIMLVAAWRLALPRLVRIGLLAAGSALMALYLGLEIRRYWQGDWLGGPGVTQYELYSYTVALMVVGAALLYQSIASRSATLRRIAMAVIAVVIAKVFLIDASGLTGLTRVFSFLGLGLSLAGLAWLNRWAGKAAAE